MHPILARGISVIWYVGSALVICWAFADIGKKEE